MSERQREGLAALLTLLVDGNTSEEINAMQRFHAYHQVSEGKRNLCE